jgi:hypothetical protein
MAQPSPLSLPTFNIEQPDLSKMNLAGYHDDPRIRDAIENAMAKSNEFAKALEKRYEQPNYFKVAAGFAKPQLGGFTASLGSAAEALGETVEQQRMVAPTVAQMQMKTSVMEASLRQQELADKLMRNWEDTHPGQPYPADIISKVEKLTGSTSPYSAAANKFQSATQSAQTSSVEMLGALKEVAKDQMAKNIDPRPLLLAARLTPEQADALIASIPKSQIPGAGGGGAGGGAGGGGGGAGGAPGAGGGPSPANTAALAENKLKIDALNAKIQQYGEGPEEKAEFKKLKAEHDALLGGGGGRAPAANAGYYPPSYQPPSGLTVEQQQAMMKGKADENIKMIEEPHLKDYLVAKSFHRNSNNYSEAMSNTESALQEADKNKQAFDDVSNLVRRAGPLAAAAEKGMGVHFGPYGASITLPASAYEGAKLGETRQAFADLMLNKIATSVYYGLLARGQTPESMGKEAFEQAVLGETLAKKTALSIRHTLELNKELFKRHADISEIVEKELPKANPNSPTKYADIYRNSKELNDYNKRHIAVNKLLSSSAFQTIK